MALLLKYLATGFAQVVILPDEVSQSVRREAQMPPLIVSSKLHPPVSGRWGITLEAQFTYCMVRLVLPPQ
jgi:hypothetical protein